MSKTLKKMIIGEMETRFKEVRDFVLVDYIGLTAEEAGHLRGKLRDQKMGFKVVKNSVFSLALAKTGFAKAVGRIEGPTAVVYGGSGGAVAISRAIQAWNQKARKLPLKGGMIEGIPGDAAVAATWAGMPSKEEILAQILGMFIAPASTVAGLLQSTLAAFPGLVKAHIEKMEKQG